MTAAAAAARALVRLEEQPRGDIVSNRGKAAISPIARASTAASVGPESPPSAAQDWLQRLRIQSAASTPRPAGRGKRSRVEGGDHISSSPRTGKLVVRNLLGHVVAVPTPNQKPARRVPRAWSELEPSDLNLLSKEELAHYEKEHGLSPWRGRAERLARLEKLAQTSTLPSTSGQQAFSVLREFLARPERVRRGVTGSELKRLERLAFMPENDQLTFEERRQRLLQRLWASRRTQATGTGQPGLLKAFGLPLQGEQPRPSQEDEQPVTPHAPEVVTVGGSSPLRNDSELAAVVQPGASCTAMRMIEVPFD